LGFLKFLKKSRGEKLEMPFDDLDIPPPPPVAKELPPMPKFDFSKNEEKMPEFGMDEEIEPEINEEMPEEVPEELPEEMPRFEEKPVIPKRAPMLTARKMPFERMEKAAVMEEKSILRHEAVSAKPIYIKLGTFRGIRKSMSVIKNDLKNADETLVKLQHRKDVHDKEFTKWQKTMEDLQKKVIFIDKTLFKGG